MEGGSGLSQERAVLGEGSKQGQERQSAKENMAERRRERNVTAQQKDGKEVSLINLPRGVELTNQRRRGLAKNFGRGQRHKNQPKEGASK